MGLVIDFLAAPSFGSSTARDRQGSASLPPRRREGLLSVVSLRRVFFASPSPELGTARDGDALTYPSQMEALGRVVASTRGVLAAQAHVAAHQAARSPNP